MKFINKQSGDVFDGLQFVKGTTPDTIKSFLPVAYDFFLDSEKNTLSLSTHEMAINVVAELGDYLIIKNGIVFLVKEEFFKRYYKLKKKIVLLNGAPACGKDTIAEMLKTDIFGEGSIHAFKDQLYKATATFYDLPLETVLDLCRDRNKKEVPNNLFPVNKSDLNWLQKLQLFIARLMGKPTGITPRQALIHVSEDVYKPKFGDTYFGKCLVNAVEQDEEVFIFVPDSGFVSELVPLASSGHDVVLIQIKRDGCSFDGDSRDFIKKEDAEKFGFQFVTLENNGTLDELKENLIDLSLKYII